MAVDRRTASKIVAVAARRRPVPAPHSLDPSIIVSDSAPWAESETIGRVLMWWVTSDRGRSALANGHGGEAPRESADPGSSLRAMDLEHAYDTVNVYRRGGELRIKLNRPEAMNAWNLQFGDDMLDALRRAQADEVRAVVVTGAGRAFSSGADLKAGFEPTPEGHPDVRTPLHERYHPIIAGLRAHAQAGLAAVNGPAVGIGCSLALAADLVIARESAYFLLAFVNIGLVPDGGSSLFVPERVGFARASEMAMLGERDPRRAGARVGPDQPRRGRRRVRRRGRRAGRAARHGPHARLRGHQAPAQRLAVRTAWTSSSTSRPRSSRSRGVGGLPRGRQAFLEKRPAAFSGA